MELAGPSNSVSAGSHAEFLEDALRVRLDGVARDEQHAADLTLGQGAGQQPQYVKLSLAEVGREGGQRSRCSVRSDQACLGSLEHGSHNGSGIRTRLDDRSGVVQKCACGGRVARGLGGHAECHLSVRDLHRADPLVSDLDHTLQLHPRLLGPPGPSKEAGPGDVGSGRDPGVFVQSGPR